MNESAENAKTNFISNLFAESEEIEMDSCPYEVSRKCTGPEPGCVRDYLTCPNFIEFTCSKGTRNNNASKIGKEQPQL